MDQMEIFVSRRSRHDPARLRRFTSSYIFIAAIFGAWLWPMPVLADSNFEADYPAHQCGQRPERPQRPDKFRDRAELDAYNEKVFAYNAAMEKYVECLQAYVDNAASDIRAIREKIEAALEEVNP